MTTQREFAAKTIEFPVAPETPNEWQLQRIQLTTETNGLFQALLNGYSSHIPIAISPDHVLNTVACIWSKYIDLNAEEFRANFVDHDGKKTIEYISGGSYSDARWPEFISGLLALVKGDQSSENLKWVDASFSTSTPIDYTCRSACMLASQKAYYDYSCTLCCGFSKITLMGKEADWDDLEAAISNMPTLDDSGLSGWQTTLLSCVASMRTSNESFWQSAITKEPYGSGGQSIKSGWAVSAFNPINSKGEWVESVDEDILNLMVDFPVTVNDNGSVFDVTVKTGVHTMSYKDDALSPVTSFLAVKS